MNIHKMITHGGRAHRDEFLAIALILSGEGDQPRHLQRSDFRLERRDPTDAELNDPDVWVVDVGGRHEPDCLNFDHHQDGAEGSALSQVAEFLGLDLSVYPWYETTVQMDNQGPGAVARHPGLEREQMLPLTDPIGKGLLVQVEECDVIAPSMPGSHYPSHGLYEVMERMGVELIDYAQRVTDQVETVVGLDPQVEVDGLYGLDASGLNQAPEPKAMALVKEQIESTEGVTISFSVSPDSRADGLALFRYEEGEGQIDLSRLKGRNGVLFAHNGGFLATTQSGDADWKEMVQEARCDS